MKREVGTDGSITETRTITFTEKKKYTQNWPAYNLAQTTEKERLQKLLHALGQGVPEPPPPETGRPRTPLCDRIFASAFKIYSTFSGRRFMTDLKEAHAKGYITKPIHYNSIFNYLEDPGFTPVLRDLVGVSALPLKTVDSEFAVDSSGFSTSRFVRWFDHKYGVTRKEHDWVKVHICTGVKTNVVTAVEIHGRDANDSPLLPPLVHATAQNFTVKEVSADMQYSSVANLETIVHHGGAPFIPFKSSATGAAGGLWEKMFHFYSFQRDTFLAHYHKRSNVESTFSMVKAKFGDSLRSKTDTAMVNEVLCKLVCHNICCVIQSQCELGIAATFWPEDSGDVLPLVQGV
jgi:transposase